MHDYGDTNPADTGVADIIKDGLAGMRDIYGQDDCDENENERLGGTAADQFGSQEAGLLENKPKKKSKKDKKKKEDKQLKKKSKKESKRLRKLAEMNQDLAQQDNQLDYDPSQI